jgi:UDP-glucose 4-epimerase
MSRKAVVIGGSGFLGSYVCEELAQRGYRVVVADQVEPQFPCAGQEFVPCDIMRPETLPAIIEGASAVYNFAGQADMDDSVSQRRLTLELNVLGNVNVLEACLGAEIERFVYASSAYAISNKGGFYGISKNASERIVREYSARFDLPFTIIRYGSLYGSRADQRNGIYRILHQALTSGRIVHQGDGEEVREYIHAADAARLSVDVVEDAQYLNEHVMLTGVERLKYKDILQMIHEITDQRVEIIYTNEERDGHYKVTPYSLHPELGKKLVANPFIDLGQGLMDCMTQILAERNKDRSSN